jgi:hypothetical protein
MSSSCCSVLCIAFGKISKEILLGNTNNDSFANVPKQCKKIFFEAKDFSQTSRLLVEEEDEKIANKPFPFPHAFIDTRWKPFKTFQDGWSIYDEGAQAFFDQGEDLVRKEAEKMDFVKNLVLLVDAFDGHAGFGCRFIEEVLSACLPKCNMQILLSLDGKLDKNVALTVAIANELCGNVQSDLKFEYAQLAKTLQGKRTNELYQRALAFYDSAQ